MKPETRSRTLLAMTRSKSKMYEYLVPIQEHIKLTNEPSKLFSLAIGMLGDYSAAFLDSKNIYALPNGSFEGLRFAAQFFDSFFVNAGRKV